MGTIRVPQVGEFIEVRAQPRLVEAVDRTAENAIGVSLSCIADDAQGELLDVLWDAELAPVLSQGDCWGAVAR